jgi:tRNA A-37 threonylcarbamoyl transferase component Bud32
MAERQDSIESEAARLGTALGSQYEIVRLIGQGGMGRVYLAREPFLDRQVAVKVLPAETADTGDARERFLREARTAARLSHPNIVPLYTFGQAGTLLFFVMGYVQGESLETRLARDGRIDPEDARQILAELADALDYAHRAGVVHRDVKPDNVLIDAATGRAMLTDFGIAKQSAGRATLTQTGMIMGTPHYMSPEQAAGDRALDGRSDLYSLGVLAYRMLAGRLPFEGESVQEILTQHLTRAPQALEQIVPGLPLELSSAVARALAKDPLERWASGRAMRDSLTGDSEESMPDEMRTVADQGVRMLLFGAVPGTVAFLLGIYGLMPPFGCAVITATGLLAPTVTYAGTLPFQRKFGFRAVMNAWLRQPRSWAGWWPRIGRRPGDVWDRLPEQVRFLKRAATAAAFINIPLVGWMLYILRPSQIIMQRTWPLAALAGGVTASVVFAAWRQHKWARAQGLSKMNEARILSEPAHVRSFWSRPEIARLLAPVQPTKRLPPPSFGSAHSIVRDLNALAADNEASAFADLYRDAAEAARLANDEIAARDAELARLAADTDPRERARIQASLDALGEPTADDRTGKQEVRALLIRQLGLFRELELRQADVNARRQRLLEHLRMLDLQVTHLRDHAIESSDGAADITARIRSLCRGADARIDGLAIVDGMLEADNAPSGRRTRPDA